MEYKQGIYTEKTQNENSEKTDPTSNDIALEIDLIYDENLTMLISLGIPSNFTMILLVKDKSFESCQPAIDKMIAMHKIMGKNVVEIKVDGEGAITNAKMNDHLLHKSISVTKLGKNNHGIPQLDRKIRTIKDHVRIIRLLTQFACGGIILLSLYFQICNIVNILPTSANTFNYSPYQVIMGRGAKIQDICPHRPLETVLVAKHNDQTNKTTNENMTKAIFLHTKNIHLPKDKREFEYLTLDSMEIITRGEGIPFEPDLKTTERLNTLANTESSKLYCPSFTKTKSKRKQGRPKKQLPDVSEGVREVGNLHQYESVTDVDREILTTPVKHPTPRHQDQR